MGNPSISILLADDELVQRNLLTKALLDCEPDLDITTAASGEELFRLLSQGTYDCLVLDCHMPPLGAPDIVGAPAVIASKSCVVAMSNHEDQSVVIDSLRGGAVDFVPKSQAFEPGLLWNCVHKAVDEKRRRETTDRRIEIERRRLEWTADTDPLTGLFNRRHLERRVSDGRRQGDCVAMSWIMLDIDHFKKINDQFGHAAGDAVLANVARFIRSTLGPRDTAFRWGGEELLILRPSTGLGESYLWADTLRRNLSDMITYFANGAVKIKVTPSIGVQSAPNGGLQSEMIDRADQAMYLAKNSGRNQVRTWPMVVVNDALRRSARLKGAPVTEKRHWFLNECRHNMSSVQLDHVTGHCERVASLAGEIGSALGMTPSAITRLRLAGLLHDIGKCLIPSDFLEKIGTLTPSEWDILNGSAREGAKIAQMLGADAETSDVISRQCNWYCENNASFQTEHFHDPLAAVLKVADAYAALTAARPYRAKLSPGEALHQLDLERGRQFDPVAVDALQAGRAAYREAA
jgi:diguanylate cyclase (GGDEF)-like protein/putative nucleotidyltransferase with HDIG domain